MSHRSRWILGSSAFGETVPFFASYVAIQCTRSKPVYRAENSDDLENLCFMWWDLWPDQEPREGSADREVVDSAVLDALTQPSPGSAIGGLHREARFTVWAIGTRETRGARRRSSTRVAARRGRLAGRVGAALRGSAARRGAVQ